MSKNNSILEIFHEEALELTQEFGDLIIQWESNLADPKPLKEIKRIIHTLKGSARMVKFSNLANFCHRLEDLLVQIDEVKTEPDAEKLQIIKDCQSIIYRVSTAILQQQDVMPEADLYARLENIIGKKAHEPLSSSLPSAVIKSMNLPEPISVNDKIRLAVATIERFSKLAGNASIARAHLEQQQDVMIYHYDALMEKMLYLSDQLKYLQDQADSELPDQNQNKAQEKNSEDFDILEFDRYTGFQKQIKNIRETTGDLFNITKNISEVILLQEENLRDQQRATYSLEEGLMRVRMVSFEYLVPRLQSIVAQLSKELGKEVKFNILEMSGEMDRSVLEKLVGPLSHMLRNAIDHGIESPKERLAKGKPAVGTIELSFIRRGASVIIKLRDDGRGLDSKKIREKAILTERLDPNLILSERELYPYILIPGFSTSEGVTQISGRGIGMDIVNSEVKKLGGNLFIDSVENEGAIFTIQLPFTLSLNQALIFQTGFQLLGILLSSISGVTRVLVSELKDLLLKNELFRYAADEYHLHYLGDILHLSPFEQINSIHEYLPVLLIETENYNMAFIVDKIIGPREIVVKTLGRQLEFVREVLGASLLGDGRLVLVLDVYALAQKQGQKLGQKTEKKTEQKWYAWSQAPKIFVVDDSVTIRKVTQRLLEKNHYTVFEAKDGMEALALMETETPNVVLLDLEMPNMGGFEVIEHMRSDPKFDRTSIVVITSRSFEKHKTKALDKGANFFLTKPFAEENLLLLLQSIITDQRSA